MTDTYRPLATITLGSTASSITFSSIPATYRDLIIVGNPLGAEAAARFNGDSGSNYNGVQMWGNGSNPLSSSFSATSSYLGGINHDWNPASKNISFSLERLDFAIFILNDPVLGELDNDRLAYE